MILNLPTNSPIDQQLVRELGALINLSGLSQPHLGPPPTLAYRPTTLFKLSLGLLVPVKQYCRSFWFLAGFKLVSSLA